MTAMIDDEEFFEDLEYLDFQCSSPWGRYLINRWRRQDGKAPFPWFKPRVPRAPT